MKTKRLRYRGFTITVPHNWNDITEALESSDAPLTIADPKSGVGALQISVGLYKSGEPPAITLSRLQTLMTDFSTTQGFGPAIQEATHTGALSIAEAQYRNGDEFLQAWFASDGWNMLFATYVCKWQHRAVEAASREMAIQSFRFSKRRQNPKA